MTTARTAETYDVRQDQALAVVIEARIRELWRERSWWRTNRWADWPDIRWDHTNELRALVKLARTARGLVKPLPESADPMTRAKWAADQTLAEAVLWVEAEKTGSYHDIQAR